MSLKEYILHKFNDLELYISRKLYTLQLNFKKLDSYINNKLLVEVNRKFDFMETHMTVSKAAIEFRDWIKEDEKRKTIFEKLQKAMDKHG